MQSIIKIFTIFTAKEQRHCCFLIFYMFVGAICEAIGIGAILPLISILDNTKFLVEHPEINSWLSVLGIFNHTSFIMFISGMLIFFYVIKNIYLGWVTRQQIQFSLQKQIFFANGLFALYLNRPYLFHLDQNSASLTRNIHEGPLRTFTYVTISLLGLIAEIITTLVIWSMLIIVDPFTAIIVAGVLGALLYILLRTLRHRITIQGTIQNDCMEIYLKWLNQGIGSIKETKVLRKEGYFSESFNAAYRNYGNAQAVYLLSNQLPRLFIETVVTGGLLLLIIVKLILGERPEEIVALLGVLALAAFRLMPSVNRIMNFSNTIKFNIPLFHVIYDDLIRIKKQYMESNTSLSQRNTYKLPFKQSIHADHLSFRYPQSEFCVLQDISFIIPKGSFIGIVGSSGAGKTTFIDILLGLLEPTSGTLLVDGKNVFTNIRDWQENLSYVPQTMYLIDGTIRENIALGCVSPEIDNAKIDRVLQMADLKEFVVQLSKGVHTMVGERGARLSGGQRQRIGIARALYYEPEVLILDEATSALDNETERSIMDTLLKLKGQITIIAIAHRVSTLSQCDFKLKFEDGRVKQC